MEKKKVGRPTSGRTVQIATKISPEAAEMLDVMARDRMIVKAQFLDWLIKNEYQRWKDSL